MHHVITIDASPKQLSKLRNGHKVRIKKGTGFNVIVHPENYRLVSRAFAKNRGLEISLSPEEIEANRSLSPEQHQAIRESNPEMAGQGIFGKKFDKLLKKAGVKDTAYKIGDVLKPFAKGAITAGLASGATALGAVQPELAPFLPAGVAGLSSKVYDYLDNPSKYQGKSGIKGRPVRNFAEQVVKSKLNERLNNELGTNYDYMSRAGVENALAQQLNAELNKSSIVPRFEQAPAPAYSVDSHLMRMLGHGVSHDGIHSGRKAINTMVSGRNTLLSHNVPPALVSQPLSANFQFQHFVPPAYQKFNSGSGLYAGRGLYA